MDAVSIRLTVYFDDPFWVGVLERYENGRIQAARMVFGAEPKDYDVYARLLKEYETLRFSPPVEGNSLLVIASNPKRRQREAMKTVRNGVGTKAQQALQLQHEQNGQVRKTTDKQRRNTQAERLFLLQQEKRKQKHRGH
jgi:hypothetical protein